MSSFKERIVAISQAAAKKAQQMVLLQKQKDTERKAEQKKAEEQRQEQLERDGELAIALIEEKKKDPEFLSIYNIVQDVVEDPEFLESITLYTQTFGKEKEKEIIHKDSDGRELIVMEVAKKTLPWEEPIKPIVRGYTQTFGRKGEAEGKITYYCREDDDGNEPYSVSIWIINLEQSIRVTWRKEATEARYSRREHMPSTHAIDPAFIDDVKPIVTTTLIADKKEAGLAIELEDKVFYSLDDFLNCCAQAIIQQKPIKLILF